MSANEQDILAGGLVSTPTSALDPITRTHNIAQRIGIPAHIADDWLKVTGGIESGNRQYDASGNVLLGPPTRSGSRAIGMGQVMPDAPGTPYRTVGGQRYDLRDPDQNIEAGLRYFAEGGEDPVARRIYYQGGPKAKQRYERTGQIPSGGDGYTSFQQYVSKTMQTPPPKRPPQEQDILAGGLVSNPTPEPAASPLSEMEAVSRQAAGTGQTTAPTPGQTPPAPTSAPPAGPQPAAPTRTLTLNDALWHFGPLDGRNRLTPRMARVLSAAVAEDERKRAAGQEIIPPDINYQNQMRQRAGLAPLKYNLQRTRPPMQIGSITLNVPDTARQVAPVYRPEDLQTGRQLPNLNVPSIITRVTPQTPNEQATRDKLQYANYLQLKHEQEKLEMQYPGGERANIAHLLHTDTELQTQAAQMAQTQIEMQRRRPEIEAMKAKFQDFAGNTNHGGRLADSVWGALASSGLQGANLIHLATGGRRGNDLADKMRIAQQALAELDAEDPNRGWIASIERTIPGAGFEATKMMLLSGIPGLGRFVLPGLGALSEADKGLGPALVGAAEGELYHRGFGAMTSLGLSPLTKFAVGTAVPAGVGIAQGQDWKHALLTNAAFGVMALAEPRPLKPAADVTERPQEAPITLPPETEARPLSLETPETIAAQMDALTNQRGNRVAVLIPKGQSAPTKIPKGYMTTRTSDGVIVHPKELPSDTVRELVDKGQTWALLGHPNPDGPEATRIVVARATVDGPNGVKPGTELMSSYVQPGQEQNAIDEMRAQFGPYQPTFEVGGQETAANVVSHRTEATSAAADRMAMYARGYSTEQVEQMTPEQVRETVARPYVEGEAAQPPGWRPGMPRPQQATSTPEPGQPSVPPVPRDHTRFYRADRSDAEGPLGKGWVNSLDYVSQKYGAGQMNGTESIWYVDVPNDKLDERFGDARAVSYLQTGDLGDLDAKKPQLYRRLTEETPPPQAPSRFANLGNEQLEQYIQNTQQSAARRVAELEGRPPKGTSAKERAARPIRAQRLRERSLQRITEAQDELAQRRAGRNEIPSFEDWLQDEAGGAAGGVRPETLSDAERLAYLKQYDAQFYPKPHHSAFQKREQGRFAPGKVEIPAAPESETSTIVDTQPPQLGKPPLSKILDTTPQEPTEAAPPGQLFATRANAAREPTADEQSALREPTIEVKPMEKQNALRSYLGNKMTMARAKAFDIIPESWRDKWSRVVDVFGGSGIHGWQIGKALGKPVHYNELDPDVYSFQQLARTNEGQEQIRRVWNPMLDELARIRQQYPDGGPEAHRQISDWWNATSARLRRPDATPAEKAARVLLENSLGTMGGTQSLIGADHRWKKDIGSLGDVSALLDKHRLNAQMWQSTSSERAEDLLPQTKPGELVVLDPPYASTKGYAVGNEHGSVNGAVNFIERSIKPAVDRGVSVLYTNSAHLPIVEALDRAGLNVRIERVQTQTRAGQQGAYRYEVTAWTPDVSPPRPTHPDVLRGLIEQDRTAGQRDLTGQTGEELWNTLIRAAREGEGGPAAAPRRTAAEQTRRDLDVEQKRLVNEAAKILAKEQHYSIKGDPIPTESVLQREIDRHNNLRDELLRGIKDNTERGQLAKDFPHATIADITTAARSLQPTAPPTPAEALPETPYRPAEGDLVAWTDQDGTERTGKILKELPSGSYRVRVDGRTAERKVRLGPDTEFRPHAKVVRETARPVGRPRLDPSTDSVEKAIRALGGIRDDGSGELTQLRESGKAGLVTKDGRSAEDMAMALAEMGYGRDEWWEGSLRQGDSSFTGVNKDQFIQAAIDDASGSRKSYSSEYEKDWTEGEEEYWRQQMDEAGKGQFDSSKDVIESKLGSELLGEIADGQATHQTYSQLREFADEAGIEPAVTSELIHIAESESPESAAARDRAVSGATEQTAENQGRSLKTYVDEAGTLHDENGEPLFSRGRRDRRVQLADLYHERGMGEVGGVYVKPKKGQALEAEMFDPDALKERLGLPEDYTIEIEPHTPEPEGKGGMLGNLDSLLDHIFRDKPAPIDDRTDVSAIIRVRDPDGKRDISAENKLVQYLSPRYEERPVDLGDVETKRAQEPSEAERYASEQSGMRDFADALDRELAKENKSEEESDIQDLGDDFLARRGAKEASIATDKVHRIDNRVAINETAREAMEKAGILDPGSDGVTVRPALAEIYAERLMNYASENPADAKLLRAVAREMRRAADTEGAGSVIVATPEAMRHEFFHEASDTGASLRNRHGNFDELVAHPAFATASARLTAAGYGENKAVLVEETAAHIAEGEYRTLGLTRKQAADWMTLWFKSFEAKNGSVSLKRFREMANEAQEALAAATADQATAERTSQRADQTVRGVQEGRETRAGPSPALAAKSSTADIANEPKFLDDVFHSQLYRTMVQKLPTNATVDQVRKIIENPQSGIKAEEVKWSGLDDFLRQHADRADRALDTFLEDNPQATHEDVEAFVGEHEKISRKEVLDFLRANQLQLAEQGNVTDIPTRIKGYIHDLDSAGYLLEVNPEMPDMVAFVDKSADPDDMDFLDSGALPLELRAKAEAIEDAYANRRQAPMIDSVASARAALRGDEIAGQLVEEIEKLGLQVRINPGDLEHVQFEDKDGHLFQNANEVKESTRNFPQRVRGLAGRIEDQYAAIYRRSEVREPTKYDRYTVPGASERYREILFTMPVSAKGSRGWQDYRDEMLQKGVSSHEADELRRLLLNAPLDTIDMDAAKRAARVMGENFVEDYGHVLNHRSGDRVTETQFRTPHWEGTPNILAHTRVDDRTTVAGEKALFINEVQSDWHQKGRKIGYREAEPEVPPSTVESIGEDMWSVENPRAEPGTNLMGSIQKRPETFSRFSPRWDEPAKEFRASFLNEKKYFDTFEEAKAWAIDHQQEALRRKMAITDQRVPPAPFAKTWHEFVMRRMLAEAVRGGYDHLAWATGEQAADLYDLSREVQSIAHRAIDDNTRSVTIYTKDARTKNAINLTVDTESGKVRTASDLANELKGKRLDEVIGKDLAKTILEDNSRLQKEITGEGLKVGGRGMVGFYDKIIPDYMRRLVKKWGSKVEDVNIGPAAPRSDEEIARDVARSNDDSEAADILVEMLDRGLSYKDAMPQVNERLRELWNEEHDTPYRPDEFNELKRTIKHEIAEEKKAFAPRTTLDSSLARQTLTRFMERDAGQGIEGPDSDLYEGAGRLLGALEDGDNIEHALKLEADTDTGPEVAGRLRELIASAEKEHKDQRMVHAVRITPEMRESLLADSQPLFRRKEKESKEQYEKRTKSALERLREVAAQRGQTIPEAPEPAAPAEPARRAAPPLRAVPPPERPARGPSAPKPPPSTTGIARRAEEQREANPARGTGIGAAESVEAGRRMLQQGKDPQRVIDEFNRSGAISADAMALVRARHEELARAANAAYDAHGLNSAEFRAAEARRQAFWNKAVRPMQTAWSNTGRAQQGETDIDTGTFYGLYRAFRDARQREPTPTEQRHMETLADRGRAIETDVRDLSARLTAELNKAAGLSDLPPEVQTAVRRFVQQAQAEQTPQEKRRARRQQTRQKLDADATVIKQNLAAAFQKVRQQSGTQPSGLARLDPEGEITKQLIAYAKNRVKAGVVDAAQLIDDVHGMVKEFAADVTRREVTEAILGEGLPKATREASDWAKVKKDIAANLKNADGTIARQALGQRLQTGGKRISAEDANAVWQYARENYVDQGNNDLADIARKVGSDLGVTAEQVRRALANTKTTRQITNEMWARMADRRQVKQNAESWVRQADTPAVVRGFENLRRLWFLKATFGHGAVAPFTHAPLNMFIPSRWAQFWPNFGRTYKFMVSKGAHERAMDDLENSPNYITAKRAGLANDPKRGYDEYQSPWMAKTLGKVGLAGNHAFDALKTMRQDMFDAAWNRFSIADRTPDLAKLLAEEINSSTGASKALSGPDWPSRFASKAMFAAPLEASRWDFLVRDNFRTVKTLANWTKATPEERYMAKRVVFRNAQLVATYGSLLALNQGLLIASKSDDRVNFTDPTKADFLTFKIAGHSISRPAACSPCCASWAAWPTSGWRTRNRATRSMMPRRWCSSTAAQNCRRCFPLAPTSGSARTTWADHCHIHRRRAARSFLATPGRNTCGPRRRRFRWPRPRATFINRCVIKAQEQSDRNAC
nr:hypothetical protein [uncultured bacterium]